MASVAWAPRKGPLSPVPLLVAMASEGAPAGSSPLCLLINARLPLLFPWGPLHVTDYSCSKQMASFRKGERPTAPVASLSSISLLHRKCIASPNLCPHQGKVFSYPIAANWLRKQRQIKVVHRSQKGTLHTAHNTVQKSEHVQQPHQPLLLGSLGCVHRDARCLGLEWKITRGTATSGGKVNYCRGWNIKEQEMPTMKMF